MCCVHGGEGGQLTKIEVSTLKLEDRGCTEPRRPGKHTTVTRSSGDSLTSTSI